MIDHSNESKLRVREGRAVSRSVGDRPRLARAISSLAEAGEDDAAETRERERERVRYLRDNRGAACRIIVRATGRIVSAS